MAKLVKPSPVNEGSSCLMLFITVCCEQNREE